MRVVEYGIYIPGYITDPRLPDEKQVEAAMAFLRQCRPTKDACASSHVLKYLIEAWSLRNGLAPYVSDGAVIEAAQRLGLVILPHYSGRNSPTAGIGVHSQDIVRVPDIKANKPYRNSEIGIE